MAIVSREVVYFDPATGLPVRNVVDVNLFGTGTLAQRPASGSAEGDIYVVDDPGPPVIKRFDFWDGSAWILMTLKPPQGGVTDNSIMRADGTTGTVLQGSSVAINDTNQMSSLTTCSFSAEFANGASSVDTEIDWNDGQKQVITLDDSPTFTFVAPPGPGNLILRLIQDGTGSRLVTWPGTVLWPRGTPPTLSTAADSVDIVAFYYNGTNYYGVANLDFS